MSQSQEGSEWRRGLSRREVLKRGAIVGAATVWTVPLISAISMTPAHADTTSAPSTNHNDGPPAAQTPEGDGGSRLPIPQAGSDKGLASTGEPIAIAAATGGALLVAGTALVATARKRKAGRDGQADELTP
jgi:hypothetical protein